MQYLISSVLKADIKDITSPLTLVGFVGVVISGIFVAFFHARELIEKLVKLFRPGEFASFARLLITYIFALCVMLLLLAFGAQVYLAVNTTLRRPGLKDIDSDTPIVAMTSIPVPVTTPPSLTPPPATPPPATPPPATPPPATPSAATPPPATPPPATPPPTPRPHEYKLVWYNHEDGHLWEVLHTEIGRMEVGNQEFKSWCKPTPFDESQYQIFQRKQVAGDEHFKEPANWWIAPPYSLPELRERWFQIMDDERWYFYDVLPK